MVITNASLEDPYTGDNSTTVFAISIPFFSVADIKATLDSIPTVDFTVTPGSLVDGHFDGGSLEFDTAPGTGVAIAIYCDTPAKQEDLDAGATNSLDVGDIEQLLDRNTLVNRDTRRGKDANIAETSAARVAAEAAQTAAEAAQALAETAQTAAELAETNAEAAETGASASASTATTQAGIATTQAGLASTSAGEASAIANGSLNTFTLLPDGAWSPTTAGEAKQITGTSTINMPAPAANFWIKYHVIGDQAVTINRNGSESFFIQNETFADDLNTNKYGLYTISCINGVNWSFTRSNNTDVYVSAPAGADGADGDMVGPVSSTDNAISRFNGTDGSTLQNSGVLIDDSNNITGVGTVDGRDIATDGTKLDGIEALADVTDETNVKSALDGATITSATVAGTDKVLVQDTDDSDNLKTVTAQSIADLAATTASPLVINTATLATITANQNNYDVGSTVSFARLDANAAWNITGLAGGVDGRVLILTNISSSNTLTIENEGASSTAANRIIWENEANASLGSQDLAILVYDGTSSRWRGARQ